MNNLTDMYTRIRLRVGKEIIVTYYSSYGERITERFKLLEIFEFSYICVENDDKLTCLDFFGSDMMIESIKIDDSNLHLYYNPYVSDDIYDGEFIKTEEFDKIRELMFKNETIDYSGADYKVEEYLCGRDLVEYDKLFFSQKQKEEFELFFDTLVNELSLYAKNKGLDFELRYISTGTSSIIYEIGDKIIKIGKLRNKGIIPYFEYLLQPIFNRVMEFDGYPIWVEVTQKVLVLENNDGEAVFSDDEQFNNIVDHIENFINIIGVYCKDLHPGNVGILLDDNKIHYKGIDWEISPEDATSILNNNDLRIMKKGSFVIIDLEELSIYDMDRYCAYLKWIGYDKNKIRNFRSNYRKKIRRK